MKIRNVIFSLVSCLSFWGCQESKVSGDNKLRADSLSSPSPFELQNYLKLSSIYCGRVYMDEGTSKEVFYRIIEIPSEEHVSLFAEKISIGQEGGNYQLLRRYRIDEKKLSLRDGFFKLDSLIFKDSVVVTGYFNKEKFSMNLEKEKTLE